MAGNSTTGDDLLRAIEALANPHRLRIIATLAAGRNYVSQLARELQISRPLLHMHLHRLEAAGLIQSAHEISEDGKAMRYVDVTPFAISLTPEEIARAARTLTSSPADAAPAGRNEAREKQ